MKRIFSGLDWLLFFAALGISIFGVIIVGSLAPGLFPQQVIYLLLGVTIFFAFSQVDYRIFEKFAVLLYIGCLFFLLAPFIFGTITRGTLRWIQIGPFTVQPSEIVKPFLVLFFAHFFESQNISAKKLLIGGLLLAVPVVLIFVQPDLGSSIVVSLSWLGILVAAGISFKMLVISFVSLLFFVPIGWKFLLRDYQKQRIFTFLDPLKDPLGTGYNLIQATVAVGAGRLFGRGLGQGTQSHLRFLPERHTDFIFASIAEELGFLFSSFLIIAFIILLWRILTISQKTRDSFGTLVCGGMFSLLFSQFFINIAMNLGLVPITGITLPLVSYGGSSFISTMIGLGILENIYSLKKKEEPIIIA